MTLPHLEDARLVAVHADALEEKGDRRAELVRAQLAGQPGEELISRHWSEWVGALPPQSTLLRWKWGHIVEAAVGATPDGTLGELLSGPAARFLRRLALGGSAGVSLVGMEKLDSLRELLWLTPTTAGHPPLTGGIETLSIDLGRTVTAPDLVALSDARLPRLTTLHTRCAAGSEEALLRAFAAASWWSTLTTWTHRVRSLRGLEALSTCAPLLARGGRGLVALCEAPLLAQVPEELRRALPHAEFTVLPIPTQPRDPEDSHQPAAISVTPVSAPINFRELPPRTERREPSIQDPGGSDSTWVGSGVPFTALNWENRYFARCGWCSAADTSCIWEQRWALSSSFETTRYASWEYECPHCGLFTHSRCSSTT